MEHLQYRTAGESHGRALTVFVEGLPAGVTIDLEAINAELRRRQGGYGRGGRMKIETDTVTILSGVRRGVSIGSPLVMQIDNRDFRIDAAPEISRPRPGHADFAGAMKWLTTDCRETLERASARETAARTAAGALAKCLLREFGVICVGFVAALGRPAKASGSDESPGSAVADENVGAEGAVNDRSDVFAKPRTGVSAEDGAIAGGAKFIVAHVQDAATPDALCAARDANEVYCPDPAAVAPMIEAIRTAKRAGDTLGGIVEVRAFGLPPGLGSCFRWQDKLDGRLMQAVGSVQAIKGVEIGLGFEAAARPGSAVHDAIFYDAAQRSAAHFGFVRRTNRAGGLEGGMTNGQTLVVRAAMKPISTLVQGMDSVNLRTLQAERSDYERSDICAVPACSVVVENVVAFELARVWLEKFAGDTLREVRAAWEFYAAAIRGLAP